jgi:hypothetical protein
MCLRFGSDPRRDFLGTARPRRTDRSVMTGRHLSSKAIGKTDHLQVGVPANCSYVMTKAWTKVRA